MKELLFKCYKVHNIFWQWQEILLQDNSAVTFYVLTFPITCKLWDHSLGRMLTIEHAFHNSLYHKSFPIMPTKFAIRTHHNLVYIIRHTQHLLSLSLHVHSGKHQI